MLFSCWCKLILETTLILGDFWHSMHFTPQKHCAPLDLHSYVDMLLISYDTDKNLPQLHNIQMKDRVCIQCSVLWSCSPTARLFSWPL